jgi:hypothetical protein
MIFGQERNLLRILEIWIHLNLIGIWKRILNKFDAVGRI